MILIVETVKVKNATIRVHDDCYVDRTEEEVKKTYRWMLPDYSGSIDTKRENRLGGRREDKHGD